MTLNPLRKLLLGLPLLPLVLASAWLLNRGFSNPAESAQVAGGAMTIGRTVSEIGANAWCIHQGPDGIYWFGCDGSGLYRIAGQEITNFTEADGLAGNSVRSITGDGSGGLLITTNNGLSRFDGQDFSLLEPIEAGNDWSMIEPGQELIWRVLDPHRNDPCVFDGEKLIRLQLPPAPTEEEFRRLNPNVGYDPAGVYTIYTDRSGNVWFGTASLGACRWDGREFSWLYEDQLVNTPSGGNFGLRSIYEDREGAFWICNTRQRFQVSAETRREGGYNQLVYSKLAGLPDANEADGENFTYFASVTQDPDGALWLACGTDGVWKYDAGNVHKYAIGKGVFAMTVYRDNAGRTWVGTGEHGLHWLDGDSVKPFSPGSLQSRQESVH